MYTPHLPQLFNPGVVLIYITKAPILYTIGTHTVGEVRLCIHGKVSGLHIMEINAREVAFSFRVCAQRRENTKSDGLDNIQQNGDIV